MQPGINVAAPAAANVPGVAEPSVAKDPWPSSAGPSSVPRTSSPTAGPSDHAPTTEPSVAPIPVEPAGGKFGKENIHPHQSGQVHTPPSGAVNTGIPPIVEKPNVYSTSSAGESDKNSTMGVQWELLLRM